MLEADLSVWTGRVDMADGPEALRWHQMVKPLSPGVAPGIVMLGFACDEGVRRNGGRVGAKDGPRAIRRALANLAWHQTLPVYEAGDIHCDDADMEGAQSRLAQVVATVIRAGHRPLILGGGHETAWGTFQGIVAAKPDATVGVINIDAHLDLRADEPGNSGTPFYQMAKWCQIRGQKWSYMCLGLSPAANTQALLDRASSFGVKLRSDQDVSPCRFRDVQDQIQDFTKLVDYVHLSVDLDVLSAATMPAVSAPAGRGISLESAYMLLGLILATRKVGTVEVVEFNPRLDADGNAVRVAAHLVWEVAWRWHENTGFW